MPNHGEHSPTPSVLMELREERQVVREGYRFLDEKRLLLASEILRQLQGYRELHGRFYERRVQAETILRGAVERHGLEGLQVHPPASLEGAELTVEQRRFLGVALQKSELTLQGRPPPAGVDPSPEARRCAEIFRELLQLSAELATSVANLERLLREYRRTSRRARALEDVILPELDTAVTEVASRLEELDQEEAIRTRFPKCG